MLRAPRSLFLTGASLPGLAAAALLVAPARAQQAQPSLEEIAQNLENPIYHQVSVPAQNNYDCCYSPAGGYKFTLNLEPVIPLFRFDDVAVVSRTIFPIIYEYRNSAGQQGHTGTGDITQAFYFSPVSEKGFGWGAGPIFLIPSEDSQLSGDKWGVGPTFAVGWKIGRFSPSLIFWHYWSFAGESSASDVSRTRLQPALAYTWRDSTTLKGGVDADYDWAKHKWTAPFHGGVSRVWRVRGHTVSLSLEGKVYTDTAKGPQGGARMTATWVLPE
jgi:hypothetical protein